MYPAFSSLQSATIGQEWMASATLILSALCCLWLLRYRRLYSALRNEQHSTLELIDNLSEGIYRSSLDGQMLSANPALVRLNGYESEAELLSAVRDIGAEWYVDPKRRDEFRTALEREGKVEDFVSEIYRHKTRERIWISECARIVRSKETGEPLCYEGSVREITETIQRLKLEEQFQKLTSQLPGGLFQMVRHQDGRYANLYLSSGFRRIFGVPEQLLLDNGRVFIRQIHNADRRAYLQALRDSAERLQPLDIEFRVRTAKGAEKWLRSIAKPEVSNGEITWHGYVADISLRKRQQIEIEELAYFDPLTELPNRRMLVDRLTQALAACARRGDRGALLFIDLDNFKTLNDTHGHDVGDAFLVQVAARLKESLRRNDIVARIGGDEFVVIAEELGRDQATAVSRGITIANQILGAFRNGFEFGDLRHKGSASIGVVVFDGVETRVDEILKQADVAMYQAKTAGRDGVALFDAQTMDRDAQRQRMLSDLTTAIAEETLDLLYQPQFDRAGNICGAEALCRWNHTEHGLMLPARFIPLAEQNGLADGLGRLVLGRGIDQLAAWQKVRVINHLRLAINVSAPWFGSPDFAPFLVARIADSGADPAGLTLELTEHVMAEDHKVVLRRMRELSGLGMRLSLHNFGAGYSSLAYLKRLPFDEVKIDGGFVADIERADRDRAVIRMMLSTAKKLRLRTVAENVENPQQEETLRSFGCDVFQGFLYSPALTAQALAARFATQPKSLATPLAVRRLTA